MSFQITEVGVIPIRPCLGDIVRLVAYRSAWYHIEMHMSNISYIYAFEFCTHAAIHARMTYTQVHTPSCCVQTRALCRRLACHFLGHIPSWQKKAKARSTFPSTLIHGIIRRSVSRLIAERSRSVLFGTR